MQVPAAPIAVCEPRGDFGCGVGGQVVQHHVHHEAARDRRADLLEKAQHVGRGVTLCRSAAARIRNTEHGSEPVTWKSLRSASGNEG
jgi:hypothetical protein